MAAYTLPALPYDYSALEPHISGRIIELHHDVHHKAYVDGANKALEGLAQARQAGSTADVASLERLFAFNLSGHLLHSIYWENLSPDGGGQPEGDLARAIDDGFGGFEAFKSELTAASATVLGSGWGVLGWEPVAQRLVTLQIDDHRTGAAQGVVPLLVVDVWEHAYYLQYTTAKARYLDALWNLWCWRDVAARFDRARGADLGLAARPKAA